MRRLHANPLQPGLQLLNDFLQALGGGRCDREVKVTWLIPDSLTSPLLLSLKIGVRPVGPRVLRVSVSGMN